MKCLFLIIVFFFSQAHLSAGIIHEEEPWFAGSLLSFYPRNAPPGDVAFQSYFFVSRFSGLYDADWNLNSDLNIHQYQLLISLETGITDNIDIDLEINGVYSHMGGKDVFNYGDTKIFFGFQISTDKEGTIIPDFRVVLGEGFPSGKFDNLDPTLTGGDASGAGAYQTFLIFIIRKILYTRSNHPYNWNLNLYYVNSSRTDVEGLSIFGGDDKTKGVVKPGTQFIANLAFEYKFNRPWGCAVDFRYEHQNSSSFHRENESTSFAELPSLERISVAPALEYNFSERLSLIGGVWFSLTGRNTEAFSSGIVSLYYDF